MQLRAALDRRKVIGAYPRTDHQYEEPEPVLLPDADEAQGDALQQEQQQLGLEGWREEVSAAAGEAAGAASDAQGAMGEGADLGEGADDGEGAEEGEGDGEGEGADEDEGLDEGAERSAAQESDAAATPAAGDAPAGPTGYGHQASVQSSGTGYGYQGAAVPTHTGYGYQGSVPYAGTGYGYQGAPVPAAATGYGYPGSAAAAAAPTGYGYQTLVPPANAASEQETQGVADVAGIDAAALLAWQRAAWHAAYPGWAQDVWGRWYVQSADGGGTEAAASGEAGAPQEVGADEYEVLLQGQQEQRVQAGSQAAPLESCSAPAEGTAQPSACAGPGVEDASCSLPAPTGVEQAEQLRLGDAAVSREEAAVSLSSGLISRTLRGEIGSGTEGQG